MIKIFRNRMMIQVTMAALLALLFIFIYTGCGTSNAAEPERADGVSGIEDLRPVKVTEATSGDVDELITRVSTVSAPNTVQILPKIRGQVVALEVEEGTLVDAGDVLARLDDKQLRLDEEKARAARDKALYDKELAQKKYEREIIGRQEYLENTYRYEQAERDYQQARIEREKTIIPAPISGVVSHRHVSLGETVFPTTPIVTLTDLSLLETEIQVPQDQIESVSVGNNVVLNPGGDFNRVYYGTVERISPVVEVQSGTVKVVVRIHPRQPGILPGQFVKAHIVTGIRRGVTLVPRAAISIENAMSVIYKVVNGFARRIPVEVGFAGGDYVQVGGDVKPGDLVVVAGQNGLGDMARVKILQKGSSGTG